MKGSFLFNAVKILLKAKRIWSKPLPVKVLIYDREGSQKLLEYFSVEQVHILDVRDESINIAVLLSNLLKGKVTKRDYFETYIRAINPDVVITFIDNNPEFYKLKRIKSDMVSVFVQNGYRSEFTDVFEYLKTDVSVAEEGDYEVDHMFVFGDVIAQKYGKHIRGDLKVIGSFLNNKVKINLEKKESLILFLSQYRSPPIDRSTPLLYRFEKPIYWDDFYLPEFFFLPLLHAYCTKKGLVLGICGCTEKKYQEEERVFYNELLGECNWRFLPRDSVLSSYEKIDRSEFVVFIDTTLGYESLARGNRTAALSARGTAVLSSAGHNFGWPSDISGTGPFWTNNLDEGQFEEVMDYITTASDKEWKETLNQYFPQIMAYDEGNKKFVELMRDLQIPLNIKYR